MPRAVADGVDARVGGAQAVVDEDTLTDGEARPFREAGTGPYPAGEDHEVGVEDISVRQLHRAHGPAGAAHVPHPALGVHLDAEVRQVPPHQRGRVRVEPALHQPLGLLRQHHPYAARGQRAGRGHPEQPAAHDDRPCAGPCRPGQVQTVVQGAERVDTPGEPAVVAAQPVQRRQHRVGAGGQDQRAVADRRSAGAVQQAGGAVDAGDPGAHQVAGGGEGDHLRAVPSGQHVGEQHPVVRRVRLLPDEQRGCAQLTEPPGEPRARETGADHHHTRVRGHAQERAARRLPGGFPPVSRAERCPQRGRGVGVRALSACSWGVCAVLSVRWAKTTTLPW